MKKYDIVEDTFWDVVGLYSKKKHPNDVGNAQDIKGPADLLVSPLDTGATATEHPIVARNPEDLVVKREAIPQPFDWDSPEEELRKKTGEVNTLVAERKAKEEKARQDEAKQVIADNKEATDAILEELAEVSKAEKADLAKGAAEAAKATPSVEEVLKQRNEAAEATRRAEIVAEEARAASIKEIQDAEREAAAPRGNLGDSSGKSAGSNQAAPSDTGTKGEGVAGSGGEAKGPGEASSVSSAAEKPNTSPTAQPGAVEPAKVEPDGLKPK